MTIEKIQEECKIRFPIGCKYSYYKNSIKELENDSYTYTIVDGHIYAHDIGGVLYNNNGTYAELIDPFPNGWYIIINEDNREAVNYWSNMMLNHSHDDSLNTVTVDNGLSYLILGGYVGNRVEITHEQFMRHIYTKVPDIEIKEDYSYLISLLEKLNII